jgi:hypothetical protein
LSRRIAAVLRSRLLLIARIISKSSYQGKYGNIVMDIPARAYHRRYQHGGRYRYLAVHVSLRDRLIASRDERKIPSLANARLPDANNCRIRSAMPRCGFM